MSDFTGKISGVFAIKRAQKNLGKLQNAKAKHLAIGLDGSTMEPDKILSYFTLRKLPFQYYISNLGVKVGTPAAYDANIATLTAHIKTICDNETAACNATIAQLKEYESNFWAIGLNGDTILPDNFNTFFAVRSLPFLPFVRSTSGVVIGEKSAYQANITTLNKYIADIKAASN